MRDPGAVTQSWVETTSKDHQQLAEIDREKYDQSLILDSFIFLFYLGNEIIFPVSINSGLFKKTVILFEEQDARPAPVELQVMKIMKKHFMQRWCNSLIFQDIVDRPSVGRTRQEQPSQPLREQNAFSDQPIRSQPSRLRPEPQLSFQPEQPIRDQEWSSAKSIMTRSL